MKTHRPATTREEGTMAQPNFETVATNSIHLRVALAGQGPLVVLVHGWPESWYSWRHQIPALAGAGYRVAAPDVRGYGGSDKPEAIEAYAIKEMCADIAGLVTALGETQAILVGHDWGAPIVWNTALFHPEKVRAVVGLSVPHTGRGPSCSATSTRTASSISSISRSRALPRRNWKQTCARHCARFITGPQAKRLRQGSDYISRPTPSYSTTCRTLRHSPRGSRQPTSTTTSVSFSRADFAAHSTATAHPILTSSTKRQSPTSASRSQPPSSPEA